MPTLKKAWNRALVDKRPLHPFEEEICEKSEKGGQRLAREAMKTTEAALDLRIHVQPKASRSEFVGLHGDRLKVRISAKPVEGAANKDLVKLIARTAGVAKSAGEIIRGETSREKDIRVHCDDPDVAARKIREAARIG